MLITSEYFAAQYELHFRSLISFLSSRGCSADDAEEIAQQAWAIAWEKRSQFQGTAQFKHWVIAIARNVRLNGIRSPRSREVHPENFESWADKLFQIQSPEAATITAIDYQRITAPLHSKRRRFLEAYDQATEVHSSTDRVRMLRTMRLLRASIFDPSPTGRGIAKTKLRSSR